MKTDQSNGNLGLESDGVEINIIHTTMPLPGSGWSRLGGCSDRLYISLAAGVDLPKFIHTYARILLFSIFPCIIVIIIIFHYM